MSLLIRDFCIWKFFLRNPYVRVEFEWIEDVKSHYFVMLFVGLLLFGFPVFLIGCFLSCLNTMEEEQKSFYMWDFANLQIKKRWLIAYNRYVLKVWITKAWSSLTLSLLFHSLIHLVKCSFDLLSFDSLLRIGHSIRLTEVFIFFSTLFVVRLGGR